MAINSDYRDDYRNEYMRQAMKDEICRMKEQMYREQRDMYMGYGQTMSETPQPAPAKPSHMNPKLLILKGA